MCGPQRLALRVCTRRVSRWAGPVRAGTRSCRGWRRPRLASVTPLPRTPALFCLAEFGLLSLNLTFQQRFFFKNSYPFVAPPEADSTVTVPLKITCKHTQF